MGRSIEPSASAEANALPEAVGRLAGYLPVVDKVVFENC